MVDLTQAVLVPTETVPDTPIITGHDFNKGCDLDSIMSSMITSGFQATALGQAINEVNRMVSRPGQDGNPNCQGGASPLCQEAERQHIR